MEGRVCFSSLSCGSVHHGGEVRAAGMRQMGVSHPQLGREGGKDGGGEWRERRKRDREGEDCRCLVYILLSTQSRMPSV